MPQQNPNFLNNLACKWNQLTIQRYELSFLLDMTFFVISSNNCKQIASACTQIENKYPKHTRQDMSNQKKIRKKSVNFCTRSNPEGLLPLPWRSMCSGRKHLPFNYLGGEPAPAPRLPLLLKRPEQAQGGQKPKGPITWNTPMRQQSVIMRPKKMQQSKKKSLNLCYTFPGHPQNWSKISKITLHVTSNKLLTHSELYTPFSLAFCCVSMQTPQMVNSKRSISTYKLLKGVFIGVKSHLRDKASTVFCYKWFYLAAGANLLPISRSHSSLFSTCLGINNVFVFPELDKFNYSLFEPIPGFDVAFYFSQ